MRGDPHGVSAAACAVADLVACQILSVPAGALPELRQQSARHPGLSVPSSWLRHADDQTVLALAAVCRAAAAAGLSRECFSGWGVVASPRCLGRASMAVTLQRFAREGAWGVSAHVIPQHSLHSPSGLLSCALKSHGPNVGVGGPADAFQVALTWLGGALASGVWVVLTALEPEPAVRPCAAGAAQDGSLPAGTVCAALALALVPPDAPGARRRLRLVCPGKGSTGAPASARTTLDWFAALGEGCAHGPAALELGPCGRVEVLAR